MRRLFPDAATDVDPADAYGRLERRTARHPALRLNMITSADGAAAVSGRSGALGGPADKRLFSVLRSLADVVLVGAGTMRSEAYGPARLDAKARSVRQEAGLDVVPPIAVVTRSGTLPWDAPFFVDAEVRPIVVVPEAAAPGVRENASTVADVLVAGDDEVDLPRALAALGERGYDNVLAEGGPGIAAALAGAQLLDELCLTLAPLLTAGAAHRILDGPELDPPVDLGLAHVLEADEYLFLRYVRR